MAEDRKSTRTPSEVTQVALIASDISYMKEDVKDIKETLKTSYVTTDQFEPVKKLVYGVTALFLITIVGAILSLVVKRP